MIGWALAGLFVTATIAIFVLLVLSDGSPPRVVLPETDAMGSAALGQTVPSSELRPKILLGYDDHDERLYYDAEGHLLTLGPTRSGKGAGAVIPNLLTYAGSMFVIDPKGESVKATADTRIKMGQKVYVIDPWNISGKNNASYNPLSSAPTSLDSIEHSRSIADAIVAPSESPEQIFWENEARNLIATLSLYLIHSGQPKRTLATVRELLSDGSKLEKLLEALRVSPYANGVIATGAAQYLEKANAEKSGVLSTARQHTEFLDAPPIQAALRGSEFRFADLQNEPTTVYLVIPVWHLRTFGRWLRLLLASALSEWAQSSHDSKHPILCIIDEFPSIGQLQAFDTAFALMAGFGVQLWPIVQDLSQLQKIYGRGWNTFVANAGVVQCFATRDSLTASYISERLGMTTIHLDEGSISHGGEYTIRSTSARYAQRPVYYPDEIIRLPSANGILFVENWDPIEFRKIRYFEDPAFNPDAAISTDGDGRPGGPTASSAAD